MPCHRSRELVGFVRQKSDRGCGLTAAQLNQISFYSGSGTGFLGTAAYNLSPFDGIDGEVSPIPEPSSILIGLSLLSLVGYRERHGFLRCRAARQRTGS